MQKKKKVSTRCCHDTFSIKKYHGEPYVLYETMVKKIFESSFSSSNVHKVIDNNSDPYRNMIMNEMSCR